MFQENKFKLWLKRDMLASLNSIIMWREMEGGGSYNNVFASLSWNLN